MATVHLLTQFIWPDAAPTGLYAEQLAARIAQDGFEVRLVGGQGGYRELQRPIPDCEIVHLDHYRGARASLRQTFAEYASVTKAFRDYINRFVRQDDLVIVTSAPPNTVTLAKSIRRRGARALYWLQDYYPELVRGLYEYPAFLRRRFRHFWDHELTKWDRVVKIGTNLGGPAQNAVVIRNWPTMSFDESIAPVPRTALYSGNLGYGHDIALLVEACAKLRGEGYRISMRADGRGAKQLPAWLRPIPLESDPVKLRNDLLRHEVHLIAASPRITQAIFPSKIWNSIAAGRRLVCTGFAGEMATELHESMRAPFSTHVEQWARLLADSAQWPERAAAEPKTLLPSLQPEAIA